VIESQEIELKLELQPRDVAAFRALALLGDTPRRAVRQVTTYYDTPEGALRKAGYSLRLRRKGRRCLQTVKHKGADSGGFSARAEWERKVDGPALDFEGLKATPVGEILTKKKLRERLAPVSETRVARTTWLLKREGSTIELILDEGEVSGGGRAEPICEIELELKKGERRQLFELAREIGRAVPLRMGVMSKSERGFELVDGGGVRARKADPVELGGEMNVAEAFAAIVQSCLRHYRLNEALAGARKAESLHQARVAIRRLRSALSLFRPAVADAEFEQHREALRGFAGELGEARNLDVILGSRRGPEAGSEAERKAERRRLKAAREEAYDKVAGILEGAELPALILDLVAWSETGAWRESDIAQRPIAPFAAERLSKRWKKVRKVGTDMAGLEPEARHRLRIDIKKLRYASEFFAALAAKAQKAPRKAFLAELEALQEALGGLNDMETARELAPDMPPAADEGALLAEAQAAHDRLRAVGAYWR
jgi:inorganic triphosphatase YgiF